VSLCRQLGQTKVEYLRLAVLRNKKIGRFDIAVDDSLRVCSVKRVSDLNRDVEQLIHP